MIEKSSVEEYMTGDVRSVKSYENVAKVRELMCKTGHDGFPVCENGEIIGYVTAIDILRSNNDDIVEECMKTKYTVFQEDMDVKDAGRIMFREGVSEVPVINNNGKISGIITNSDIIRSQIERSTPSTVMSLKNMLSQIHGDITFDTYQTTVRMKSLHPTQDTVMLDELEGRMHELRNGLAEPVVVIRTGNVDVLADGHHRAVAASRLGIHELDAYVIETESEIDLGMLESAKKQDLSSVDDIKVDDEGEHPLISQMEVTDQSS